MYTAFNFRTKKALRDAVNAGEEISCYQPGPFNAERNGRVYLEGPHYPEPHKWYASAEIRGGFIVKGSVR